ncbi:MAG: lactate racemase domain-containing protein, partial [Spirochaetaceae bacterium]|nr:lactate racemase domain-containing protein [Spirochaetaceae bacterium]
MTYVAQGGSQADLCDAALDAFFSEALGKALEEIGHAGPLLILPPDITRFHSRAGYFTDLAVRELARNERHPLGAVIPALGTHVPMTQMELHRMFPGTPLDIFIPHDWRRDVVTLGRLEAPWVAEVSQDAVYYDWPVQVNQRLRDGGFSLIVSIGQVVPHEVVGMANHGKNIFVGTGGKEAIDKSHFAGACYGMERMMGRTDTPVRALFDEGLRRFGSLLPPILWVLTVVGPRSNAEAA